MVLVGLTGLRPEEWLALEWRDFDRKAGVIHVHRVYRDGQVKLYSKQERSLRAIPLPLRAAEALEASRPHSKPPGSDRGPYALRHTYASFAIAAGVSLFELARFMGASVEQIDRTYGHLLRDSIVRTLRALDAFGERLSTGQAQAAEAAK